MTSTEVSSPYLDMWKDWEPEVLIRQKDTATREWVPAEGLTGVTFRVSLSEQGAAIGALTNIPALEAAGAPGRYVGAVDLATLASELPDGVTYPHGTPVFLQVVKPGDIQVEAIKKLIRRRRY